MAVPSTLVSSPKLEPYAGVKPFGNGLLSVAVEALDYYSLFMNTPYPERAMEALAKIKGENK